MKTLTSSNTKAGEFVQMFLNIDLSKENQVAKNN